MKLFENEEVITIIEESRQIELSALFMSITVQT